MANYIDEHLEKVKKTPGGNLCEVLGRDDGATCSIAVVHMDKDSVGEKHYHDTITEVYVFSKGKGRIIINGHVNEIRCGEWYLIEPGNVHYIETDTEMDFLCVCTPPWEKSHEFVSDEILSDREILGMSSNGVIEMLSENDGHVICKYEIYNSKGPSFWAKNYKRIYYIVSGTGKIVIDNEDFIVKPGDCYLVDKDSNEELYADCRLEVVLVTEFS